MHALHCTENHTSLFHIRSHHTCRIGYRTARQHIMQCRADLLLRNTHTLARTHTHTHTHTQMQYDIIPLTRVIRSVSVSSHHRTDEQRHHLRVLIKGNREEGRIEIRMKYVRCRWIWQVIWGTVKVKVKRKIVKLCPPFLVKLFFSILLVCFAVHSIYLIHRSHIGKNTLFFM